MVSQQVFGSIHTVGDHLWAAQRTPGWQDESLFPQLWKLLIRSHSLWHKWLFFSIYETTCHRLKWCDAWACCSMFCRQSFCTTKRTPFILNTNIYNVPRRLLTCLLNFVCIFHFPSFDLLPWLSYKRFITKVVSIMLPWLFNLQNLIINNLEPLVSPVLFVVYWSLSAVMA